MADFDFSTLITDRAPADLEALRDLLATPMSDWTAEQLAAFNQAASKGAYNYTDLNRVTACMDYLNERLTALGYVTGYQRIEVPHQEPQPSGRLPEGYTELAWIEGTGTQYIDTGFNPTTETRLVMEISDLVRGSSNVLFGSRNPNSPTSAYMFGAVLTSSSTNALRSDYFGSNVTITPADLTIKTTIDKNENLFSAFGITAENTELSGKQCPDPLFLFCYNNEGSAGYYAKYKLYSCKIYNNGVLIRDFVPCTNPTGTAGLYDLIGNQFYSNAGAGEFAAGPEVPQPEPTLDPYTWYEEDAPTATQMQQYLANVGALRGALVLPEDTVGLPGDMAGLTQAEANAIEGVLGIINDYLEAMQRIFLRSGMAWAISGGPNYYFAN